VPALRSDRANSALATASMVRETLVRADDLGVR